MKGIITCVFALSVVTASNAAGQMNHLEDHIFPPEAVMQASRSIGLDEQQRTAITEAIREFERSQLELEWQIQDAAQALTEIMRPSSIDEAAALAQAALVMDAETRMKQAHLRLLIRIKNLLSEEQQLKLREVMDEQHKRHELELRHRDDQARHLLQEIQAGAAPRALERRAVANA